jgi:hypothetical protein
MALSTDANRILRALKEAGLGVGQWLDNRFIQTSAVQELADAGYITVDQNKRRLALTELGRRVVLSQPDPQSYTPRSGR